MAVRATPIRKEASPIPTVTSVETPTMMICGLGCPVGVVGDVLGVSPLVPGVRQTETIISKNFEGYLNGDLYYFDER